MARVADQLATAVGAQWKAEARVRRLYEPYPLPVSWVAADPGLTVEWGSLVNLATSGAGWPPPPSAETWADGPDDLAGEGQELATVLGRVPTGRLVVLGEPGAGKTILMIRLVLDLLENRPDGGPVPILASIASWNPPLQDLRDWLGAQLLIDHPGLANPPPDGMTHRTQAEALLGSRLILPILDGLDEIPEEVRASAIGQINDALRPGERLVVTCRSEQYLDAIRPKDGRELKPVEAAAAIRLCPLDLATVHEYLRHDAPGPDMRARWDRVFNRLGKKAPAREVLSTPLMVGLARTIYNSPQAGPSKTRPDPVYLRDRALADRKAVESLLLDEFIPAAYRQDGDSRWKAQDAERWLVFLARHLERKIGGPDLAWWQLRRAMPRTVAAAAAGAAAGAVAGVLLGVAAGAAAGAAAGLGVAAGFVFGAGVWSNAETPARGIRIIVPRLAAAAAVGAVLGALLGALIGDVAYVIGAVMVGIVNGTAAGARAMGDVKVGLLLGLLIGLLFGLTVGLTVGLLFGLKVVPGDLAEAASPQITLARDRQAALLFMLVLGVAGGVVGGLAAGLAAGVSLGVVGGVAAGVAAGLAAGAWLSTDQAAWPSYLLTVGWLAFSHRLPRSLMDFLSDAHERGVLRQAGAVYQFRHIELQHRLANRAKDEQ
jgi:NACHT domain